MIIDDTMTETFLIKRELENNGCTPQELITAYNKGFIVVQNNGIVKEDYKTTYLELFDRVVSIAFHDVNYALNIINCLIDE